MAAYRSATPKVLHNASSSTMLSGYVGASVHGLDLKDLGAGDIEAIQSALARHLVLFFPAQSLRPDDLVAFAEHFGEIERPHGGLNALTDKPKVMVTARKAGGGARNDIWHSDVSFDETPPSISILQAIEVPERGGDTLFSSMYAAYETLSPPLRELVEDLEAFHDGVPGFIHQISGTPAGDERIRRLKEEGRTAIHPVVRRHPDTGRKALYINRLFTQRIMGLSEIESRNLLDLLCEHIEQASFQVRWRWGPGDVAMWDNRCVMHYAANDVGQESRLMHRVTLKGERPSA